MRECKNVYPNHSSQVARARDARGKYIIIIIILLL